MPDPTGNPRQRWAADRWQQYRAQGLSPEDATQRTKADVWQQYRADGIDPTAATDSVVGLMGGTRPPDVTPPSADGQAPSDLDVVTRALGQTFNPVNVAKGLFYELPRQLIRAPMHPIEAVENLVVNPAIGIGKAAALGPESLIRQLTGHPFTDEQRQQRISEAIGALGNLVLMEGGGRAMKKWGPEGGFTGAARRGVDRLRGVTPEAPPEAAAAPPSPEPAAPAPEVTPAAPAAPETSPEYAGFSKRVDGMDYPTWKAAYEKAKDAAVGGDVRGQHAVDILEARRPDLLDQYEATDAALSLEEEPQAAPPAPEATPPAPEPVTPPEATPAPPEVTPPVAVAPAPPEAAPPKLYNPNFPRATAPAPEVTPEQSPALAPEPAQAPQAPAPIQTGVPSELTYEEASADPRVLKAPPTKVYGIGGGQTGTYAGDVTYLQRSLADQLVKTIFNGKVVDLSDRPGFAVIVQDTPRALADITVPGGRKWFGDRAHEPGASLLTNGHIMYERDALPPQTAKLLDKAPRRSTGVMVEDAAARRIWNRHVDTADRRAEVAGFDIPFGDGTIKGAQQSTIPARVFLKAEGYNTTPVTLNAEYLARAVRDTGADEIRAPQDGTSTEDQPVVLYKNERPVGLIMRLRGSGEEVIPPPPEVMAKLGNTPEAAPGAAPGKVKLKKGQVNYMGQPMELMDAITQYFAPGNIVHGYGGVDRVVELRVTDAKQRKWSVDVQQVDPKTFEPYPGTRIRHHGTRPDTKELRAGPLRVAAAETPSAASAWQAPAPDAQAPVAPAPAGAIPPVPAVAGDFVTHPGNTAAKFDFIDRVLKHGNVEPNMENAIAFSKLMDTATSGLDRGSPTWYDAVTGALNEFAGRAGVTAPEIPEPSSEPVIPESFEPTPLQPEPVTPEYAAADAASLAEKVEPPKADAFRGVPPEPEGPRPGAPEASAAKELSPAEEYALRTQAADLDQLANLPEVQPEQPPTDAGAAPIGPVQKAIQLARGAPINGANPKVTMQAVMQRLGYSATVRWRLSQAARRMDVWGEELAKFKPLIDRLTDKARFAFIDDIENHRLASIADPQLRAAGETLGKIWGEVQTHINALPEHDYMTWLQDYFPHLWDNPEAAANWTTKMMNGTPGFLKKRTIPTLREGMIPEVLGGPGLKPITSHPFDAAMTRLSEVTRFIGFKQIMADLQDQGLLWEGGVGKGGKVAPAGWQKIINQNAPFYAPAPVAELLNRFMSPGLGGKAWYEWYMAVGSRMNAMQLGLSAFHGGMSLINASITHLSIAASALARGDVEAALGSVANAGKLGIGDLLAASPYLKEWFTPGSVGGQVAQMIDYMEQAGGRVMEQRRLRDFDQFLSMVRQQGSGGLVGTAMEHPVKTFDAAIDYSSRLIMRQLIPRLKVSAFAALAKEELVKLGPNPDALAVRDALMRSWDSVDNRFGQVVHDNIFWDKTLRDVLYASVRSVGWNLGDIREFGGGVKDINKIKRLPGGGFDISPRLAFTVTLPIAVGMMGALTQYLMTGQGPQELRDYYFPKTGKQNAMGMDERIQFPTYMKDIMGYSRDFPQGAMTTVEHKLNPLLNMAVAMLHNKDFFGNQIYNKGDPTVDIMEQAANYISKQMLPFSVQQTIEGVQRGEGPQAMAAMVGVTPAPTAVVGTPAQMELRSMMQRRRMSMTPEERQNITMENHALTAIQQGQGMPPGVPLSMWDRVYRRSYENPMVRQFQELSPSEAEIVFRKATPQEQAQLVGAYYKKQVGAMIDAGTIR